MFQTTNQQINLDAPKFLVENQKNKFQAPPDPCSLSKKLTPQHVLSPHLRLQRTPFVSSEG